MNDAVDIRFLLSIREAGSLAGAARKLGVTPSAVTKRLQQIETKLDVHLLDRSTRQLRFTEEGELLCSKGAELLRDFDSLLAELGRRRGQLVGGLKVNAPLGFGRRYVARIASAFKDAHPDVDVSLTLSDRPLIEEYDRYDIVVHIGELGPSNLVRYVIAPNARYVCASPAFLERYGSPANPEDLANVPCIALRQNNEDVTLWHFSKGRTSRGVRVSSGLSSNDGDVIHQWAREGRGVMLRSEWDVAEELQNGSLIRLLPGWKLPDADVIALVHQRTGMPARIKTFLQHLQREFRPRPPWRP
ncbi:LysR family transcriptional regulator [Paraburkholderia nemoris]|uniref:LysR family transcriptional regulator n=1 Tax=Paraburkholderia nemoris TaxID=2793076 RepID=UPI0038BBB35B